MQDNYTETCSIHSKGKYVVAERFIRTLKYEMYKYVTLVSKNVYINKWDDRGNKYSNSTIKMKAVDLSLALILILVQKIMPKFLNLRLATV